MKENFTTTSPTATESVDMAKPISKNQRIQTLDVLRGMALFGILFINVGGLVTPGHWFYVDWHNIHGFNKVYEMLTLMFAQGKFYTIFSILFGLGFATQLASAQRKDSSFIWRFFWRMLILTCIGLFHMVFIWDGDILTTYAIAGLLLLLCFIIKRSLDDLINQHSKKYHKLPRIWILIFALLCLFGPINKYGLVAYQQYQIIESVEAGAPLTTAQQVIYDRLQNGKSERGIQKQSQLREDSTNKYRQDSYVKLLQRRLEVVEQRINKGLFWFHILGLFLIGVYFGRCNLIGRAAELKSGFIKLCVISLVIGFPVSLLFVYSRVQAPIWYDAYWTWLQVSTKSIAGIAFAFFYISLITLLMLTPLQKWLRHFAPLGQMALTSYLIQSTIGTMIFYGPGFNLVGNAGGLFQLCYVFILFSLQLLFCRWWLSRYQFGPVEWFWRSATYGQCQPMRIKR